MELAENAPVALNAPWNPDNNFRYQIWTNYDGKNPGKHIGYFNDSLNLDLFQVLNRITKYSNIFRPPNSIQNLYLTGVSCFAASEDDSKLVEVHEPFASTGIWLVPIVFGYPRIEFFKRNYRRRG